MSDGEAGSERLPVVGYQNPPTEYRFKKGVSGNPKGRPRKTKASPAASDADDRLSRIIMQEAYRPIQIRENGKTEELPMIQAVIRSLGVSAAKGSFRAQLALTGLVQAIERRELNEKQALFETIVEYKRGWEEVFERCDALGEPRPEPVPHPHDLEFNSRTGTVVFNGPFDDGEKASWDRAFRRKKDAEEEIAYLTGAAEEAPELKRHYDTEIEFEERIVELISSLFPDEATRRVPGFNIYEWRQKEKESRERRARWRQMRKVE